MIRLSLIWLCVVLLGLSGCNQPEEENISESKLKVIGGPRLLELSPQAMDRSELTITPAGSGVLAVRLSLQGDVTLNREKIASVVSRIGGTVDRITVGLGQTVEQGQVLAELESLELADIKMAYVESEHQLDFAREALAREEKLWKKKITSQEDYIAKKHEVSRAEINHSKALHRLRLLGYGEEYLHSLREHPDQDNVARLQLRAPLSGEIIHKDLMIGQSVQAELPLFKIADLSELMISFHLPIKYLQGVTLGHVVQVECECIDLQIEATVVHLSSLVREASRTVNVLARITNPDSALQPGMAVRVTLAGGETELKVGVPRSAIQEINGQETVFVQTAPLVFELRSVTVGKSDDELVEIIHGLRAGEQVVSNNSYRLKAEWFNRSGE